MKRRFVILGISVLPLLSPAEAVKDREGAVRADKAAMEHNERWIYNDVEAGFAEAKRTGKPLMVVLRCVPCLACMGIDTEVLVENDEITPLMDEFVRVRVIITNALDLSLFQFDYDLSFSVLFFNGDGTIYGRFGSWEHQKDTQNKATATFRQALEGALALHSDYPANKALLTGKKGAPMAYKTPVDMPGLKDRFRSELDWNGKVVKSCVHCHQIGDAIRLERRDAGKPIPLEWVFPYPSPEAIGISFEDDPAMQVSSVTDGSIAEKAGLSAGDRVMLLRGQAMISEADFSWVLHRALAEDNLDITVDRGGKEVSLTLSLPVGWRHNADISRRVGTWPMRAMAFGGMKLRAMSEEEKTDKGIASGKLALLAENVGQYGAHAAAKLEGFVKGDIIVEVDGSDIPLTETQLLARHVLEKPPGTKVPAIVLRDGKRIELKVPVQ